MLHGYRMIAIVARWRFARSPLGQVPGAAARATVSPGPEQPGPNRCDGGSLFASKNRFADVLLAAVSAFRPNTFAARLPRSPPRRACMRCCWRRWPLSSCKANQTAVRPAGCRPIWPCPPTWRRIGCRGHRWIALADATAPQHGGRATSPRRPKPTAAWRPASLLPSPAALEVDPAVLLPAEPSSLERMRTAG